MSAHAQALRDYADWLEARFPRDLFPSVDISQFAAVHAAINATGVTVEQWSAHLMRHSASLARYRASELDAEGRP